jgi:hypothetical protein
MKTLAMDAVEVYEKNLKFQLKVLTSTYNAVLPLATEDELFYLHELIFRKQREIYNLQFNKIWEST